MYCTDLKRREGGINIPDGFKKPVTRIIFITFSHILTINYKQRRPNLQIQDTMTIYGFLPVKYRSAEFL